MTQAENARRFCQELIVLIHVTDHMTKANPISSYLGLITRYLKFLILCQTPTKWSCH